MSAIIPGLGGYTCIRDNHRLGYCVELAIESLLKVCEEVVVADADSTDGTLQTLQRMADRDSRIKIVRFPWTNPKGVSHHYWVEWLNFARSHLTTKYQITLDGDEVLDSSEACHTAIRTACTDSNPARRVRRNNYWKSPEWVIPTGYCCADRVVRLGLAECPMPSDQPVHPGEYQIVDDAKDEGAILIHHLGFLRPKEQFYRKADAVLSIWFNRGDQRLEFGEKEGKQLWETEAGAEYNDKLVKHGDVLPDEVQKLLCSWGHFTQKYVPIIHQAPDPIIEVTESTGCSTWNVLHCGDYGDVIHMLPMLKALGRVNLFFQDRNSICKRILERLHILQPLLESQPYILSAKPYEGEEIHWNAGDFRIYHSKEQSLAFTHWLHYKSQKHLPKIKVDLLQPWMNIYSDPRGYGKIVIHRTSRYQNAYFRWGAVVHDRRDSILFMGTQEEHRRFCEEFGEVPYCHTKDLLEMAQIIAGSELFMGNQSVGLAIAEAIKHPRIVELCPWQPDVIIGGGNVQWSSDGAYRLPAMGGRPELVVGSGLHQINYLVQTSMNPRCGWFRIFPEFPSANTYDILHRKVKTAKGLDDKDTKRLILDRLHQLEPSYFGGLSGSNGMLEFVNRAMTQVKTTLA